MQTAKVSPKYGLKVSNQVYDGCTAVSQNRPETKNVVKSELKWRLLREIERNTK